MNLDPSALLFFAIIISIMGNNIARILTTVFGARQDMLVNGDIDPKLRKLFDVLATCFTYIPAACLYIAGFIYAWHLHRVSTVIVSGVNGLAFLWLFKSLKSDSSEAWSIKHFRTQRKNLLLADSVVLCLLLFGANSIWHYPKLLDVNVAIFLSVIFSICISNFEADCWKKVGVNINGSIGDPLTPKS